MGFLKDHSVIVQEITTSCEIMQDDTTLAGCGIMAKKLFVELLMNIVSASIFGYPIFTTQGHEEIE